MLPLARRLVRTSRPRFWFYLLGPYVLGSFAAAPDAHTFTTAAFWAPLLFFTLPANLFVYGVNDIHDFATDARNAKKAGYEALVAPAEHRSLRLAIAVGLLGFLPVLASAPPRALPALVAFLFLSYFYSAPPIRAKARPLLDASFNVLYATPGFYAFLRLGDEPLALDAVAGCWAWCMAMHAFSAVPDITADGEAGVPTVATWLGARRTLLLCGALYAASDLLLARHLLPLPGGIALAALAGAAYLTMIGLSLRGGGSERSAFTVYRWFPVLNVAVGFVATVLVIAARWPVLRP
jgi:lycopene elongase/hydratase (dihydrobisanhydrobacterioruberin-forming)